MNEPMIPKSMHVAAVQAAETFAAQRAEEEATRLIALIVEAAGGEVRLSRRYLVDDPPELVVGEDVSEPLDGGRIFRTRRQ